MNRSLKLSMLLALALGSSQAVALELGQIQVKSALGQPLLAEIPVTPESPADLRNLSARLASNEDFARAGITDGRTAVPLNFAIVNGPGGSKLIRITSNDAINDPYLDLLVQVDNAAGKSVREYTILLDPPGVAAAPPPVAAAPSSRAPAVPGTTPRASRPAAAPAASRGAVVDGQFGPVQSGQNLSSIAQQVMPAGADLNQTLLALKQANPDAFYRDNINALKSGAVLRVPTADEARAMSAAAAMAEVRRQNGDWRSGTVSAPTAVADSATRAGASTSPSAPATPADDHLALVPSADGKGASAGSGKGGAEVRRELQRSQESLATLQQQGAELKSRLKDLEDINGKNERLLALKDNEIAELQRKLAEAQKGAGAEVATATPAKATTALVPAAAGAPANAPTAEKTAAAAAGTAMTPAMATPVASTSAASATAAATPAAVAPKPAKKPAPVKRAPAPTPVEDPWYMQTWAWAAGAVAIALALLLALRGRRSKAPNKPAGSSLADRFGAAPLPVDGSDDPDQDELLDQLAEHPDDVGLHLELVSLYYHRRDVEHFEAAAEAMYAHISDPQQSEWQDVAAMGEDLVPGHPLFVGVDTSVPENEREPLGGFDLDSYPSDATADSVPPPMPAPTPAPAKVSEYHFDFNLTPQREPARAPLTDTTHDDEGHADTIEDVDFAFEDDLHAADTAGSTDAAPAWQADGADTDFEPTEFSDDPIDTKLDLARAYLDMGDADGARAMLEEVLAEGSQPQRDVARRLLDGIA
ncbi:FimV/HubP family polar landmark protein [Dyella sp.]|jgi:pilus assembly protein FimV|uniref:FimV/HubP family polar landmark protein n=1 Tax=Dyella sp. TaxID=1869338 RepID=UPI002D76A137|nr:FimV/HubP family polar landmark protein [Dyella sp.]HET6432612.1 FimV/HubP family polar landmark protein [Dyella sp.]